MMNKDKNPLDASSPEELDLLAFRYVAAEMTQEERDAFESLLETNQLARESVADAVGLAELVYASYEEQEKPNRAKTGQSTIARSSRMVWRSSWLALAGMVVALVTAGVFLLNRPGDMQADTGAAESESVAMAWVEVIEQDSQLADNEFAELDFESDLIDDGDVSWMLAALTDLAEAGEER